MPRQAKIAAFPESIREQLNLRLLDGQNSATILPWLNQLPEVQSLLGQLFRNQPVSASNLSNWKLGGFQDWRDRRELMELFHVLAGETSTLPPDASAAVAEGAAAIAACKVFKAIQLCDPATNPDRLPPLVCALSTLRHENMTTRRLAQIDLQIGLQERRVKVSEERAAAAQNPPELVSKGGITPETLAKVEEALHLM